MKVNWSRATEAPRLPREHASDWSCAPPCVAGERVHAFGLTFPRERQGGVRDALRVAMRDRERPLSTRALPATTPALDLVAQMRRFRSAGPSLPPPGAQRRAAVADASAVEC